MFHPNPSQSRQLLSDLRTAGEAAGLDWATILQMLFSSGLPMLLQALLALLKQQNKEVPPAILALCANCGISPE